MGGLVFVEEADGADEAGGDEGRVGAVGVDGDEGDFLGVGLGVADEAVDPEVGDADFDGVVARVKCGADVDAEGCLPDNPEGFAVDGDFGEVADVAEVEEDGGVGAEPVVGDVEVFGVGDVAGEVLDGGLLLSEREASC